MKPAASGTAGRPTLAAVAARAGVSASTASLAFSGAGPVSDATRARVLTAARDLDYAGPDPRAQSLRRGRSGIVGVVLEDRLSDAFRDPMNIAMLDGISDVTGTAGASLLLLTEAGEDFTALTSAPMDAVILVGCSTRLDDSVAVLRQRRLPIVAIEAAGIDGVLTIGLDNRPASRRAAEHLRALGHERVGVVTLPLRRPHVAAMIEPDWRATATSFTATERLLGVQDVFPQAVGFVATGSEIDAGREAGLALLGLANRPTAILAQSDLLAVGVFRAAEEMGIRVPDELSLIGFDGIRIDGMGSQVLATLVQPAVQKGRAAGQAVLDLLAGERGTEVSFTSEFRVGTTTARVPGPSSSSGTDGP